MVSAPHHSFVSEHVTGTGLCSVSTVHRYWCLGWWQGVVRVISGEANGLEYILLVLGRSHQKPLPGSTEDNTLSFTKSYSLQALFWQCLVLQQGKKKFSQSLIICLSHSAPVDWRSTWDSHWHFSPRMLKFCRFNAYAFLFVYEPSLNSILPTSSLIHMWLNLNGKWNDWRAYVNKFLTRV